MMMEILDRVIVGAGVIGVALAYAFRERGETLLLESEPQVGTGISSRNSGVIHAGLYYPKESLKLRFCLRGAQLLYDFAQSHGVEQRRTGKYLVANSDEELAHLEELRCHAGPDRLYYCDPPPGVRARAALLSPNTGIVDAHGLIKALINASGVTLLCGQQVTKLQVEAEMVRIEVNGETYFAREVFNCTGLSAARFAKERRHFLARGSYFQLKVPAGLDLPALVYPAVPKNAVGLGIHLTQNVWGEAYLGPDVEWIETEDYSVDPNRLDSFLESARSYLPWLEAEMLLPAYAGIRPKLDRYHFRDFELLREGSVGQLVHCLGIESPGLTAALAIAEHLAAASGV